MAISRVPGYQLLANLDRQGTDLYFTTNSQTLAYLDFTNYRLGINTSTPQSELEVVGNILVALIFFLITEPFSIILIADEFDAVPLYWYI